MALGPIGYVGYGKETTEGTQVAPTIFLPVMSFNFEDTNEYNVRRYHSWYTLREQRR